MRLKLQKSYIMIKILKKEMISKQVFMDLYMKVNQALKKLKLKLMIK
jgi:hypothetical protein